MTKFEKAIWKQAAARARIRLIDTGQWDVELEARREIDRRLGRRPKFMFNAAFNMKREMAFIRVTSSAQAHGFDFDSFRPCWKKFSEPLFGKHFKHQVYGGSMTDEMAEWLDLNLKDKYTCERIGDPNLALYSFKDKGNAAMFKLVWAVPKEVIDRHLRLLGDKEYK